MSVTTGPLQARTAALARQALRTGEPVPEREIRAAAAELGVETADVRKGLRAQLRALEDGISQAAGAGDASSSLRDAIGDGVGSRFQGERSASASTSSLQGTNLEVTAAGAQAARELQATAPRQTSRLTQELAAAGSAKRVPGVSSLEAVVRGRGDALEVSAALQHALLGGGPRTVAAANTLHHAEAYQRRSSWLDENQIDAYRLDKPFELKLELGRADVDKLNRNLLALRGKVAPEVLGETIAKLRVCQGSVLGLQGAVGEAALSDPAVRAAFDKAEGKRVAGSEYTERPNSLHPGESLKAAFEREYELHSEVLTERIGVAQAKASKASGGCPFMHGNHAKGTIGEASFEPDPRARAEFVELLGGKEAGFGGAFRFSNSSSLQDTPDGEGNLMGFRMTFDLPEGEKWTITANSAPLSHVRTTSEHVDFTNAVTGKSTLSKLGGLARLAGSRLFGRDDGVAPGGLAGLRDVVTSVRAGSAQTKAVSELDRMNELMFDSRATYRFGSRAVRYQMKVVEPAFPEPSAEEQKDPDYRHRALMQALKGGELKMELRVQVLKASSDEEATRMVEDMDADWTHLPSEPLGIIKLPKQDLAQQAKTEDPAWLKLVEDMHSRPVDPMGEGGFMQMLGQAPRARKFVYEQSAENRKASPRFGLPEPLLDELGARPLQPPRR